MPAHATTGDKSALWASARAHTSAVARLWRPASHGEARAVHRLRTSTRRLRELLPLVAAAAPDANAARVRREARRLTRALGVVRELDVALSVLDEHVSEAVWTSLDALRVREALMAQRETARKKMRTALDGLDVAA